VRLTDATMTIDDCNDDELQHVTHSFIPSSLFAQQFRRNTTKSNKNRAGQKLRMSLNTDIRL